MGTIVASQSEPVVVGALGKMRDGILLVFIGWILLGVGLLSVGVLALAAWSARPQIPHWDVAPRTLAQRVAVGWAIASVVLVVVGAVLALVGFYAKFVPGVGDLARARPEFGTASGLIRAGYLGGLVLLVVGAVLTIFIVGILLLFVGVILLLLGHVGAILLCFKLNDAYPNTLYLVAGILLIVSIFVPVLGAVSWILLYFALGDTIVKLRTPPA